jgi:flagellar assembly factor FliW
VPADITKITTNLKAPIVINPVTLKGCQIIVDNDDYVVRYPIYDILKSSKVADKEGE